MKSVFSSGLPYMTALAFYALSMLLTGKIIKRDNTNVIAVSGLLIISLGFFIASQASSLMVLVIGYGVLQALG